MELRVNDTERMVFSVEGGGLTCGLTEDECKQKQKKTKKIRVVFVLFESVGCGVGRQVVVFGAVLVRAPTFCAEGGVQLHIQT